MFTSAQAYKKTSSGLLSRRFTLVEYLTWQNLITIKLHVHKRTIDFIV